MRNYLQDQNGPEVAIMNIIFSTHKQLEVYGCTLSTVASDALVLKHKAISIHSELNKMTTTLQMRFQMCFLEWLKFHWSISLVKGPTDNKSALVQVTAFKE